LNLGGHVDAVVFVGDFFEVLSLIEIVPDLVVDSRDAECKIKLC